MTIGRDRTAEDGDTGSAAVSEPETTEGREGDPISGASMSPAPTAGTLSLDSVVAGAQTVTKPVPRRIVRSGRDQERWRTRAMVAAAALAGVWTDVSPGGTWWSDRLMAAGFVAVLAAAGSSAKRWTWLVVAASAVALADGTVAVTCGVAALALVLASAGPIRPEPATGAAVGALAGLALLRATGIGFHGSSAVMVALATAPMIVSGYRLAPRRTRQRVRRGVLATASAAALVCAIYAAAAANARPAAHRGVALLRQGMDAAREGDDARATARLAEAADAFAYADRQLNTWYTAPAKLLPIVGHNARAAATIASSAAAVSRDGTDVAVDADVDTLTVQGGRLDLERVRALGGPLDEVARVLDSASRDLASVDDRWLLGPVADQLDDIRGEVAAAQPDVDLAAEATRVVPAMFGGDGESRWLVAFVTPIEARGRTGFMGNFAELTAIDGAVDMTRFGRASELEEGGTPGAARTLGGPDDYLTHWSRFQPAATWRNVTMSPDFPAVGQVMAELYPQSSGQPVDGVIAIDPAGLAALMTFTGPIEVPGLNQPLTSDTAAQFLLRDQYLAFGENADRIDMLETVARATFDRLTTGDLPAPGRIGDVLGPAVRDGHVHAYGADPDHQALFADIGVDGALPDGDGDSLAVVANNAVGNKTDLFLQRAVDYAARWDPDTGEVSATATVALTNNAPASGLPEYMIGNALEQDERPPPRGTNRTYLSIYSPWHIAGAELDGVPVEMERQVEAGRYAYSLFLDIPPEGGTKTVTLHLRGHLDPGDDYTLDVSTQPLVNPDQWSLAVNVAGSDRIAVDEPLVADGRRVGTTGTLTRELTTFRIRNDA